MIARFMIVIAFGIVGLFPHHAEALQLKEGYDNGQITAFISMGETSRIALEHDRVRLVNANPEVSVINDAKTGDLFIQPIDGDSEKPVNLFVATEKGFTYQLLLLPKKVPSEQILIHNRALSETSREAAEFEKAAPFQTTLITMMRALIMAQPLTGFAWESVREGAPVSKTALTFHTLSTLKGAALEGRIIEVNNPTESPVDISEADFYKPGLLAVHIPARRIDSGGKIRVYAIAHSGDEQ